MVLRIIFDKGAILVRNLWRGPKQLLIEDSSVSKRWQVGLLAIFSRLLNEREQSRYDRFFQSESMCIADGRVEEAGAEHFRPLR
jgi:hypothetical protein